MNEHAVPAPGKLAVGLTGGIGSGKSTVAELFRTCGAAVIDSDTISHQLTTAGGKAIPALRAEFGDGYIDSNGALERARMRELAFTDSASRQRLEAILHPLIRDEILAQAKAVTAPYLLLVVPLLFEAPGYIELVQRTLVIDCPEDIQIERTMLRSKLSEQQVKAIVAQQLDRTERLRHADDVIHNDAGFEQLRPQVEQLHREYLALASGKI